MATEPADTLPEPYIPQAAAVSFIEGEFGGPTEEVDSDQTIGTTMVRVTKNDPERLALVFINLGTEAVYLSPDNQVASTHGIFLAANGGSMSMNVRDDFTLQTREWWAVAPSGNTTLYQIEIRRYART